MLTNNGKALVVVIGLRLLFGVSLVWTDLFRYDDTVSALTVFAIYALLGFFTLLFVRGKKTGLTGILVLSTILILFHTVFIFVALSQADAGVHGPLNNLWSTFLRYPFYLLTLFFCVKIFREKQASKG